MPHQPANKLDADGAVKYPRPLVADNREQDEDTPTEAPPMRSKEYDAAYFTLLRAREEHQDLLRYRDFLDAERTRLDAFAEETRDTADALPRKVRRPVAATTKPLLEAVGRRRVVVLDERRRVDDRIAAAEAFVAECQEDVDRLRA